MTRFETLEGQSLGQRVASKDGATWFASTEELQLLWSLDEFTEVVDDNCSGVQTVGELKDLFSSLRKLSNEEVETRFGSGRSKSGLSLQLSVSDDGKLFWTK